MNFQSPIFNFLSGGEFSPLVRGRGWRGRRMFPGYTVIDVVIGMTLCSFLVLFIAAFIREVMIYSTFITRHQQIRQETFAIVNHVLAAVIREAVAIDYNGSSEEKLSLFTDKFETPNKRVSVELESEAANESSEERSQLVLKQGGEEIFLNSQKTYITDFSVEYPTDAKSVAADRLQDLRALQPMVKVRVASRYQRPVEARDRVYSFWENPRVSYEAAFTLRNYSFSNLR